MKKPGLAGIVIGLDKAKGADEEEAPDSESDGDYHMAVDELAEALGVSEEKRDAFAEAFKAAVHSCK